MEFSFGPTHLKIVKAIQPIFVVGGAVRDSLLGVPCHDIDFATPVEFEKLGELLMSAGLNWIPDKTAAEHGIYRVIDPNKGVIDVAVFRKDIETDGRHAIVEFTNSISDDLGRRDLTINAMASQIRSDGSIVPGLIDPFDGWIDLTDQVIRLVGKAEDRINEDYLRMLRVARFATKLGSGSNISDATIAACRANASKISSISKERIREEIEKALTYDNAGNMFRWMQSLGLLEYIIPDLHRGVSSLQNKEHAFSSVFDHLCRCVDACKGKKYTPMLKLATLFHDVAKPHTRKVIDGDATFHNHEVVGASLVYNWMKEYKFSTSDIQYVVKMVRHHQWRMYSDRIKLTCRDCGWKKEFDKD